jgi:hypothetical protein
MNPTETRDRLPLGLYLLSLLGGVVAGGVFAVILAALNHTPEGFYAKISFALGR